MSCVKQVKIKLSPSLKIKINTPTSLKLKVKFINFGNRFDVCPIIYHIDGGDAFTTVFPPINGVLNGGGA